MREEPRPIETPDDVVSVLESPKAGLPEILDCIEAARLFGRWDLLEASAARAFLAITDRQPTETVVEVARHFVLAEFALVPDFESLPERVRATQARLAELEAASALSDLDDELCEILEYVSDASPASLIRLCSRLRRFDRPDLGYEASVRALRSRELDDEGTSRALTTGGAALVDLGHAEAAIERLQGAWDLTSSPYAANALSRACIAAGRPDEAVTWAQASVANGDSAPGLWSLLTAATAVGDQGLVQDVSNRLRMIVPEEPFTDCFRLYLSAKLLAEAGQHDQALAGLAIVAESCHPGLANKLGRDIGRARSRRGHAAIAV